MINFTNIVDSFCSCLNKKDEQNSLKVDINTSPNISTNVKKDRNISEKLQIQIKNQDINQIPSPLFEGYSKMKTFNNNSKIYSNNRPMYYRNFTLKNGIIQDESEEIDNIIKKIHTQKKFVDNKNINININNNINININNNIIKENKKKKSNFLPGKNLNDKINDNNVNDNLNDNNLNDKVYENNVNKKVNDNNSKNTLNDNNLNNNLSDNNLNDKMKDNNLNNKVNDNNLNNKDNDNNLNEKGNNNNKLENGNLKKIKTLANKNDVSNLGKFNTFEDEQNVETKKNHKNNVSINYSVTIKDKQQNIAEKLKTINSNNIIKDKIVQVVLNEKSIYKEFQKNMDDVINKYLSNKQHSESDDSSL